MKFLFIFMVTDFILFILIFFITDLECIFTVICDLVSKSESPDEALEMAKLISAKITQQPNDKPALRLKM